MARISFASPTSRGPGCPACGGIAQGAAASGGATTVNVSALLVPGAETEMAWVPSVTVDAMTQLEVSVVGVVVPVIVQVIPVPAFTAVAAVRLVPVRVIGTVAPCATLVGLMEISPAPVAVPVSADACVPAESATDSVADSEFTGSVVSGRNCTLMAQLAPTARLLAGPQVDVVGTMVQSAALGPDSVPCEIPVSGTVPVLSSVNICIGPFAVARFAVGFQVPGVRLAVAVPSMPVPVRVTGEPETGTSAVMVSMPETVPAKVGENTTLIVHEAPTGNVAAQVPAAVAREKTGEENANVIPVALAVPELASVRVFAALVVASATFPNAAGPPVTESDAAAPTPAPARVTGEPETGTLAVMVSVPGAEPAATGENTTLIVHEAPDANVVVQVPPDAGRE